MSRITGTLATGTHYFG